MAVMRHKEAIHSGHFMVSNFEAEAQDDEEDIAVPVPEEAETAVTVPDVAVQERAKDRFEYVFFCHFPPIFKSEKKRRKNLTEVDFCTTVDLLLEI